jgi:CelD/BcsL family acetyltransferase involved in cellulose biosynthesis
LRKNRFHEKHLASHGDLEWRFVSGSEWSREIFDAVAQIERRSWVAKETSGKDAKFMAPHNRLFWENAARDPEIAEMMSAAILYVAGEPAAFSFDLDVGPVKHAIANSYDERFAKHSPGKLLYYRNLVRAMERGIRLVDWGAGDGGYKRTIGAEQGPAIVDLLFVRGGALAALLRPFWERSARG